MINTICWNLVIHFQKIPKSLLRNSALEQYYKVFAALKCYKMSVVSWWNQNNPAKTIPISSFCWLPQKKQEFCKNRRNILNWQLHRFLSLKNFKCFLLPTFDGCLKKFYCFQGNLSWSTIYTSMGREFLPSLSQCPCERSILE